MVNISVIIPTFNEEKAIGDTIERILAVCKKIKEKTEVIVVDDGSTDNTANLLKNSDVILLKHTQNIGYGAAIKTGIRKAKGEWILICDADGTYPIEDIPRLLEFNETYDMIVGARTGKKIKIPAYRKPAKWIFKRLAEYLTKTNIPDLNSGLRLFKRADVLKLFTILPNKFSFTTTITLAYLTNNLTVKYVPINYEKRIGKSKISPIVDGLNFILLILRTVTYFRPLRIFLPLSFTLLLFATVVYIYSILYLEKMMDVAIILLVITSIQIAIFGLLADLIAKQKIYG